MRWENRQLAAAVGVCLFGLFAGAAFAQKSTVTETKSFEIISVDGNKVVVRGAEGSKEITVTDDFRLDVGGRQLSVQELKPGMKGEAKITTTVTSKPVYVTDVRQGVVKKVAANSVLIYTDNNYKTFNQSEMDKRSLKILRDGKPVQLADLRAGDRITATIVTEGPPEVLTERQVQATLAASPAAEPSTTLAQGGGQELDGSPASPAAASTAPAQGQEGGGSPGRTLPGTASSLPLLALVGLISLAAGTALRLRRRSSR